jgi:type I restriction enzyme S subunit
MVTSATIPKGYKQTEVGVMPDDWQVAEIGDLNPFITSGSRGWADFYSETGSAFVRITNMSRASIYLDLFDLKLVKLPPGEKEGTRTQLQNYDVLISITADIGIIGYVDASVPKPAYINQHIALVRFDATKAHSQLVSYFLAGESSQRLFRSLTDQGAKAGMSLGTVRKIKLALPLLPEQTAIASVLSDMDALTAKLEALITKKKNIKKGAMQELLTGKRRLPGFSGGWQMKKLGELLDYEQPTKYLVKETEYSDDYDTPVLTAGKTFILGYTSENSGIFQNLPTIIFDDFTTANKYVDFPFKAKSSAMKMLKPRNMESNLRFIYEKMQLIDFTLGDHKRYWISEYQNLQINMPNSDEQTAIATVLSDMDAEIRALEEKLAKYKLLKIGMMQRLLTGKTRVYGTQH